MTTSTASQSAATGRGSSTLTNENLTQVPRAYAPRSCCQRASHAAWTRTTIPPA